MVPNPGVVPTPFPPVSLDYFYDLRAGAQSVPGPLYHLSKGAWDAIVPALLTSKKHMVKAITGHIS